MISRDVSLELVERETPAGDKTKIAFRAFDSDNIADLYFTPQDTSQDMAEDVLAQAQRYLRAGSGWLWLYTRLIDAGKGQDALSLRLALTTRYIERLGPFNHDPSSTEAMGWAYDRIRLSTARRRA